MTDAFDSVNAAPADGADAVPFVLDCSGLRCPLPLLRAKQQLHRMQPGEVLEVIATDSGAVRDIPAWLAQTTHVLLEKREQDGRFIFRIARR